MSDVTVTIKSGKLRGLKRRAESDPYDYHAFLGIPYAEPPTGELKFKDPVPVKKWEGVRDAIEHGQICAQLEGFVTGSAIGGEDCLFLNVYTRNLKNNAANKPTMVWIHGGAFLVGWGNGDMFGPEFLLRNDVVLVTINYRVGVFGFLNLDDEVATGNQGLKDMVLALKWVKENIESFGGDSGNVTIFGGSAGGCAVHHLTLSPLAKGLFHKVIAQSGLANGHWATVDDPKSFALRLCKHLGFHSEDPKEMVEFLRKADCRELAKAQNLIRKDEEVVAGVIPFAPSVDKKSKEPFFPDHPIELAKNGVSIPLMLGHTNKEGFFMLPIPGDTRPLPYRLLGCKVEDLDKIDKDFGKYLHPRWMESLRKKYDLSPQDVKALYFGDKNVSSDTLDQWVDLNSDMFFVHSVHELMEYQVKHKFDATFLYVVSYDSPFSTLKNMMNIKRPGACHADDVSFIFSRANDPNHVGKCENERKLMEQMSELWTNFAKTGNPTPEKSDIIPCKWEPVNDATNLSYFEIGEQLKMKSVKNTRDKFEKAKQRQ